MICFRSGIVSVVIVSIAISRSSPASRRKCFYDGSGSSYPQWHICDCRRPFFGNASYAKWPRNWEHEPRLARGCHMHLRFGYKRVPLYCGLTFRCRTTCSSGSTREIEAVVPRTVCVRRRRRWLRRVHHEEPRRCGEANPRVRCYPHIAHS